MNFLKLLRSFRIGFLGLANVARSEQNMRVHLFAAVGVVGAGCWFRITGGEWIAIVLSIGIVIAAECFNTAVERLADRVTRENDLLIQEAKDCSAAAVLAISIAAAVVGAIVFVPKIVAAI